MIRRGILEEEKMEEERERIEDRSDGRIGMKEYK